MAGKADNQQIIEMRTFSYHKPKSVRDTIALLNRYGEKAAILSGGTDLLVELKRRDRKPSHIVSLQGIPGLLKIEQDGENFLHIGPCVTMQTLSNHPALSGGLRFLAQAASLLGSWQIRNRATLGGNVCHASPSGDTLPALLCLKAMLKLEGLDGERVVPVENFFLGPGQTAALSGEMLTDILIPQPPAGSCGVYKKFAWRKRMDLALAGVAVLGALNSSGERFSSIRIGLGAVAPTPIRARKTEDLLTGSKVNRELIADAAARAATESSPISDLRANEGYRREIIEHLTEEALQEIWVQGRKNPGPA